MARRSGNRGQRSVLEILVDPLFGLIGALIVVFIMQVIATINMVDQDLVKVLEDTAKKNQQLRRTVSRQTALKGLVKALEKDNKELSARADELYNQLEQSKKRQAQSNARARHLGELVKDLKEKAGMADTVLGEELARLKEENAKLRDQASGAGAEVTPQLRIATLELPAAVQGRNYMLTMAARGGLSPLTWALDGDLPLGLELDARRGLIKGVPEQVGDTAFTLRVRDAKGRSVEKGFLFPVVSSGGEEGEQSRTEVVPLWISILLGILLTIFMFQLIFGIFHYRKMKRLGYEQRWVKAP